MCESREPPGFALGSDSSLWVCVFVTEQLQDAPLPTPHANYVCAHPCSHLARRDRVREAERGRDVERERGAVFSASKHTQPLSHTHTHTHTPNPADPQGLK